jgi:hypothetical protein
MAMADAKAGRSEARSGPKQLQHSIHIHMLDGVNGRSAGVLILRNGTASGT